MRNSGCVAMVGAVAALMVWCGVPAAQDSITGLARVIDGDTIEIRGERIRLEGVDTPERYQRCLDGDGRSYRCGDTATEALRRAIGSSPVRCDLKAERGRWGRAIGFCYGWDGRELNRWLVRQGYGLAYRKYSRRYVAEERGARAARRGMHSGRYVEPWKWRRGERLK